VQRDDTDLEQFLNILIDKTGLEEQYRHEDTEEALSRLENINEMRNSVHEYVLSAENPTLEGFLENVSLVTDLDRDEGITDCVVLMTLHSAKGLEFDNVFIPGLEENIFPSYRSLTEEGRMEEERRLMYVGITRARRRLFLSYAASRMMFDGFRSNPPSPFIDEIPERLIERTSSIRENRMAPYMSAKKTYANRFMNSESVSSGRNGVPRASGSPSMPKARRWKLFPPPSTPLSTFTRQRRRRSSSTMNGLPFIRSRTKNLPLQLEERSSPSRSATAAALPSKTAS
jgi:DNA helicase-2/ATP-dependent DNA helicase PcrA